MKNRIGLKTENLWDMAHGTCEYPEITPLMNFLLHKDIGIEFELKISSKRVNTNVTMKMTTQKMNLIGMTVLLLT